VVRRQEGYNDMNEADKIQAPETLVEYSRGSVSDANEGIKGLWHVTTGYLYREKQEAPDTGNVTPQREET
jgi:hypothetical protein